MRTRTNRRAFALAGKSVLANAKQGKSFTSGLLFGLSAASLFLGGELRGPKAPTDGIGSDWKAVGKDVRSAMRRHG
jgi:hypothetical protein